MPQSLLEQTTQAEGEMNMHRQREQTGSLYKRGGFWVLRYRQTINEGGELKTIQRGVQLAEHAGIYKSKHSEAVKALVEEKLKAVNNGNRTPERVTTLGDFVERVYLPYVKEHKRASTYKGYAKDIWASHLKARCASALLRDVKTYDVQHWLEQVAREDGMGKRSLQHQKHFLSGVFRYAAQQGYWGSDRPNPVQMATIPEAAQTPDNYAYSLPEIKTMLAHVPEPAATMIAVAALGGLRHGELWGLEWGDYTPSGPHMATIEIRRSIWRGKITPPKTAKSAAAIPVIPYLEKMLEAHRLRSGGYTSGPMFRNAVAKHLDPHNLVARVIEKTKGIDWHGWHAFRRGIATNLHQLGVADIVIQMILRHSDVSVTRDCYIKSSSIDTRSLAAMQQLENALTCADRALEGSTKEGVVVN
jgi:integrase